MNHLLLLPLLMAELSFVPLESGKTSGYVVSLGECETAKNDLDETVKGRPVYIGYRSNGKSGSQVKTAWLADCDMKKFPVTKDESGWSYVNLEKGEGGGMIGFRTAQLRGDKQALLASLSYGHETVRRKHVVCVADEAGAVSCPWKKADPWSGAPVWNFLGISDLNGDGKPEVYHRLTDNSGSWAGSGADGWQLRILAWDEKKKAIQELRPETEGAKVWATVLGSFRSLDQAQKHYKDISEDKRCAALWVWLSVLPAKEFPSVTKDMFFIGGMFLTKADAEGLLRDASACKLDGYIKNVY